MRLLTLLFLASLSFTASATDPIPASATPLVEDEAVDEPQVTITKQPVQKVEEFRANGKLYMIKVTPKHGVPYYLVDDKGDGKFARQEGLDSGVRVPRWVIFKF
ncbi:MAG: DUF2782 domain-containing protein [Sideroxydans sp.]|nr:DUF2782 domain-containing protein [Sideroxydans sp.]